MLFNCILFGTFIGYFLYQVIGNIVTLLVGPLIGYKFISFSFLGLEVAKVNEKLQFRFTNPGLIPETMQYIKPNQFSKRIIREIIALVVGITCVVVGNLFFKDLNHEFARGVVLCTTVVMGLLYVWNLIIFIKMIIQMYGSGFESQMYRDCQNALARLEEGVHPKDIIFDCEEPNHDYFGKVMHRQHNLLTYYKELENGDLENVDFYIDKMKKILPVFWSVQYTPYYYEVLYYYSALRRDVIKAESYASIILNALEQDKDVNGRRVYAAYLFYTGKDRQLAAKIAREGLDVIDKFPTKGLAYMERDLINKMLCDMENKEYESIFEK